MVHEHLDTPIGARHRADPVGHAFEEEITHSSPTLMIGVAFDVLGSASVIIKGTDVKKGAADAGGAARTAMRAAAGMTTARLKEACSHGQPPAGGPIHLSAIARRASNALVAGHASDRIAGTVRAVPDERRSIEMDDGARIAFSLHLPDEHPPPGP